VPIVRTDRRAFWLVVQLALSVCILAAPARAATLADFNGDGLPDPVTAASAPSRIFVKVSGLDTQVLHVADRILTVVAADVDHDGRLDLSTFSVRRGLSVWLNRGGHFVRARRAHPLRGTTVERPGPLASPAGSTNRFPSAPAFGDANQFAQTPHVYRVAPLPARAASVPIGNRFVTIDWSRVLRSRAPPVPMPS
jgi:hypothetical protein